MVETRATKEHSKTSLLMTKDESKQDKWFKMSGSGWGNIVSDGGEFCFV